MTFPILQLLLNSLIIGSIYALVAAGFNLIYQTNRFMHFAHGASVSLAAYTTFHFFTKVSFNYLTSILLAIAITTLVSYLTYKFIYTPLQKNKSSTAILLIASLGLLMFIENLILLLFGSSVKPPPFRGIPVNIGSASITHIQLILVITTITLFILLHLFLKKTKIGRNLRAVADNEELAQVMGLHTKKILTITFIIATILASIAGVLIGLEQNLEPTMGTKLVIKGFSGAIIGGLTSIPGGILGSYIIGVAENFGIWFLPAGFKDAITFIMLFIFLLVKPQGLLGKKSEVKQ